MMLFLEIFLIYKKKLFFMISGKVLRKKNLKPKTEPESCLSFDYCFVAQVTASNLQFDRLVSTTNTYFILLFTHI